ncbi:MAG: hypothetical protein ACYTGC_18705, partial [Planctomycetota bacterium]
MTRNRILVATAGIACWASPALGGSIYQWQWEPGSPGQYVYNDRGGAVNSITAVFDENTSRLSWEANFGPASDSGLISDGFSLALNAGGSPFGIGGELAMLYFDATGAEPVLSVYGYNGLTANDSFRDGAPDP